MAGPQFAEVQLDNTPSMAGDCTVPMSGAWTSDLSLFGDVDKFVIGQSVTLTIHGVQRKGTVVHGGAPDLRYDLRVVGGAGKLDRVLPWSDYKSRDLAYVVQDVLQTAGEVAGNLSLLRTVSLAHWVRAVEPARMTLRRLMKLAPTGVFLRVQLDGTWAAVKPTWAPVGGPLDGMRVDSMPAEDAVGLYVEDGVSPEPGTSILLFGSPQRVDRSQYEWGEDGRLRVYCWIRDQASVDAMDRLRSSIRTVVEEILRESRTVDFGGMYSATLLQDGGANGKVNVKFNDDLGRMKYLSDVTLYTDVGTSVQLKAGSRVLVGWANGEERYPFALAGSWSGGGGLTSASIGDVPTACDPAVTRQDLLDLVSSISNAATATDFSGATFKANLLANLTAPPPAGKGWGTQPNVPGSSIIKIKR